VTVTSGHVKDTLVRLLELHKHGLILESASAESTLIVASPGEHCSAWCQRDCVHASAVQFCNWEGGFDTLRNAFLLGAVELRQLLRSLDFAHVVLAKLQACNTQVLVKLGSILGMMALT